MLRSLRFFAMVIGLIFAIQISCVAGPSDDGHLFPVKRGNLAGFIDIKVMKLFHFNLPKWVNLAKA